MSDPILKAAVQKYALAESATRLEKTGGRLKSVVRYRLDELIGTAHHYDQADLAASLLILALADDRPGGPERCLSMLRYAAADLDLPLPLPLPLNPRCEHGVPDGDWCDPCNRACKDARKEAP